MRKSVVWMALTAASGLAAAGWWRFAGGRKSDLPAPKAAVAVTRGMGATDGAPSSPPTPPLRRDEAARRAPTAIRFHDVTADSGITFVHCDGSSGRYYILETITAGVATFDYDGDGLIDIYFPNGAPLPGLSLDKPPRHALYKNLGNWRFRDVTEEAGVVSNRFGLGVAIGDYNDDGWPDIYLNNYGHNVLWRNNGDGTFTDVTSQAGVERKNKVGAGANFLDIDKDGELDLFVASYVQFSYESHHPLHLRGRSLYPSPLDHPPDTSDLFRNNGDGTFTNVTRESGIGRYPGTGMGTVAMDYDRDGATDIYVANDEIANFLFHNDGRGKFEEVGIPSGAALDGCGLPQGSMGVDCGDFDNDLKPDLLLTSFENEGGALYRNLGSGAFMEIGQPMGLAARLRPYVTWGCALVDLDNDGDRDLFIVTGHTDPNADVRDGRSLYKTRNIVLENLLRPTGKLQFVDVSDRCGDGLLVAESSRGAAFDDLDNDGDIDVVILNSRSRPTILRNMLNESGSKNHWLQIRLRGVKTNRDGVGAQVIVTAGDLVQLDEVHSGRGYQGHFGSRLHFGLGEHHRVDRIEVRWIGGGVDVIEDVPVDRCIVIQESSGVTECLFRSKTVGRIERSEARRTRH